MTFLFYLPVTCSSAKSCIFSCRGPGPWVDGVIFLLLAVKDEVQVLRDIFAFCVIPMADNFQDRPRFGAGFETSCELPRNKARIISVLF